MVKEVKNVAVIGCGYWGKNLVRNFFELGALRGIYDEDARLQHAFEDQYKGIKHFASTQEVLSDPSVKGVAVATPAATHHAITKAALLAGKDVFVEKPIALTYAEGQEIAALAAAHSKILMVGHILEYHPAVVKLKDMVRTGELGKINYIYSNRLNLGKFRTEENILWSFAPHDISIILSILNEMPSSVATHGGEYLSTGISDVTVTNLSFPSGTKAHIFVSWLHPYKEQKLVVVGSKRMAVFNDTLPEDKLVLYDHHIEWIDRLPVPRKHEGHPVPIEKAEPLKNECAHFLECLETRGEPLTGSDNGLKVLRVLEASQQSLERKGAVLGLNGLENQPESPNNPSQSGSTAFFIHPLAVVDDNVTIGDGTKIWHFAHVQSGTTIGRKCVLGQNVNIANNVSIGSFVKIQNNVSVYEGVTLEDYVFCGPSMVFTNITDPRSKYPQVGAAYYIKTLVREGASLGANSTIVCGHTIGRFAFIGAGAVVTRDVPDFALVVGNPARITGWMSEAGRKLTFDKNGIAVCDKSAKTYILEKDRVVEVKKRILKKRCLSPINKKDV
ncbi:MAG: Gfo/Idh/MocA family oxidoreductase [Acidobacteria bacterium]|nr:Gfo/Idh/MocA family oxidoreductase [Acidobacteriota bacterium]